MAPDIAVPSWLSRGEFYYIRGKNLKEREAERIPKTFQDAMFVQTEHHVRTFFPYWASFAYLDRETPMQDWQLHRLRVPIDKIDLRDGLVHTPRGLYASRIYSGVEGGHKPIVVDFLRSVAEMSLEFPQEYREAVQILNNSNAPEEDKDLANLIMKEVDDMRTKIKLQMGVQALDVLSISQTPASP